MKKILYSLAVLWLSSNCYGQTITNGGFETLNSPVTYLDQVDHAVGWEKGCVTFPEVNPGTPDLHDCSFTNGIFSVPAGGALDVRTSPGNCRFVGMLGPLWSSTYGTYFHRETIKANTGLWTDEYIYTVSFYVARIDLYPNAPEEIHMQAVLRKSGDCQEEKIIDFPTEVFIENGSQQVSNNWTQVQATFHLTAAESEIGFDQIEFRSKYEGTNIAEKVYVDDFSLSKVLRPMANVISVNNTAVSNEESLYGPQGINVFCLGEQVIVDGSGSELEAVHSYTVKEIDLSSWTVGAVMYSTGWINGQAPNSYDISDGGNVDYDTGQVYLLTFAVGSPWHADYLLFRMAECCPSSLPIFADCDNETLSVQDIPTSATNVNIDWYYNLITGNNTLNQIALLGNSPTIDATMGYGTYVADITFDLPYVGTCTITESFDFSEGYCCQLSGPSIENYRFNQTGTETYSSFVTGVLEIPILGCRPKLKIKASCYDGYYVAIRPFDLATNSVTGQGNAVTGNAPLPLNFDLATLFPFLQNGYYQITMIISTMGLPPVIVTKIVKIDCNAVPSPGGGNGGPKDDVGNRLANDGVSIQPNPSQYQTTVQLKTIESGTVSIKSMQGNALETVEFKNTNNIDLDVSTLPSGMYFIEVTVAGESVAKKFIKN